MATKPPVPPGKSASSTTAPPPAATDERPVPPGGNATVSASGAAAAPGNMAAPGGAPVPAAGATTAGGTPPTPAAPGNATPATPADIEALADSLSGCADALHERIMDAIRKRGADPGHDLGNGIAQDAAQSLFDQEVLLRQSANRLYVQAAVLATAGLGSVRVQLMDVTAAAREQLRHVATVQALVALTADLVTLAGAIAAGKPGQWPAAVRDVRDRIKTLHDAGKA